MDGNSAVTVEQLPVPVPLDTESSPAEPVTIDTIVQEIPQIPTETVVLQPPPLESEPQQDSGLDAAATSQEAEVQDSPAADDSAAAEKEEEEEENAYWAEGEEDTSAPDEAELAEIEAQGENYNSLDCEFVHYISSFGLSNLCQLSQTLIGNRTFTPIWMTPNTARWKRPGSPGRLRVSEERRKIPTGSKSCGPLRHTLEGTGGQSSSFRAVTTLAT